MIINFPGHLRYNCGCEHGQCCYCAGGLYSCTRCGGAEGSLPTDCPGCYMPDEVEEAVMRGEIDFDRDRGWVQEDNRRPTRRSRRWLPRKR